MKAKKWVSYGIFCLLIPAVVAGGALLFEEKQYAWVSLCAAVLACVPFFLHFERKTGSTQTLILVAAMVALSVVGRILFTPLPGFKPVTALVVITGMYFGGEAGFMTGALSAVISNFWFGQGPWTPFQMVSWGLIGFIAGLLASPLRQQQHPAGSLRVVFRRAVFAADGHLDRALAGRLFQPFPLLGVRAVEPSLDGCVRAFQRHFPSSVYTARRQGFRTD